MRLASCYTFPLAPRRGWAQRTRWFVASIEFVVGVSAVFGGYGLLSDANGLGAKQAWLDGSLFPDYTIPGLVLLVLIGGGMLLAAAATVFAERYATITAGGMAVVLALWGVTETVTVGWRGWAQVVLLAVFVVGPALALGLFSARAMRGTGAEGSTR
jgi:hypothetical protein